MYLFVVTSILSLSTTLGTRTEGPFVTSYDGRPNLTFSGFHNSVDHVTTSSVGCPVSTITVVTVVSVRSTVGLPPSYVPSPVTSLSFHWKTTLFRVPRVGGVRHRPTDDVRTTTVTLTLNIVSRFLSPTGVSLVSGTGGLVD